MLVVLARAEVLQVQININVKTKALKHLQVYKKLCNFAAENNKVVKSRARLMRKSYN